MIMPKRDCNPKLLCIVDTILYPTLVPLLMKDYVDFLRCLLCQRQKNKLANCSMFSASINANSGLGPNEQKYMLVMTEWVPCWLLLLKFTTPCPDDLSVFLKILQ